MKEYKCGNCNEIFIPESTKEFGWGTCPDCSIEQKRGHCRSCVVCIYSEDPEFIVRGFDDGYWKVYCTKLYKERMGYNPCKFITKRKKEEKE